MGRFLQEQVKEESVEQLTDAAELSTLDVL